MENSLNLIVFTSTKGHFDHKEIYKTTIDKLFGQIDPNKFALKVVHIKHSENDPLLPEMVSFFASKGFWIIESKGEWKHFDSSHQEEYLKDIVKVFCHGPISMLSGEYTLWLEDDWVFRPTKPLEEHFDDAMNLLKSDTEILTARFCYHENEFDRINDLLRKHGLDRQAIPFNDKFFLNNDLFSFNPNISRTSDLVISAKMVERNFDLVKFHCEMGFSRCILHLSNARYPFAAALPEQIRVEHIGVENYPELIKTL